MAIERPIKLSEGNDKWPPSRWSLSPSAKLVIEDFGLALNSQRFRSLEKDVISIPIRSGSAPPSMEVSTEKIGLVYLNSSSVDSEIAPQPSSFTCHGSIIKWDERVSGLCGGSTVNDRKITPHTESADVSVQVNGKIVPSNEEDPEDVGSSESSASTSVDKAAMFAGHSGSLGSTQVLLPYDPCAASAQSLSLDDGVKALTALNSDHHKIQKKEQLDPQENTMKHYVAHPEGTVLPAPGSNSQAVYPGKGHAYGSSNQLHHGSSSVSKAEVQPVLQTSGFTPPFCAQSASFMLPQNSGYPILPPVGFVTQQYSMGGNSFNSAVIPSYLTGYPPPATLAFESASFPPFGASKGRSLHAYDIQNLEQFYGQVGVSLLPPPAYPCQYFQPTVQNTYGAYYKYDHQEDRENGVVSRANARDLKKGPAGFQNDFRSQDSAGGGHKNLNVGRGNVLNHSFLVVPTVNSHIMQIPSASFSSPVVLPGHFGGTHFLVEKNNTSLSQSVYGNNDKMHGLQNQSCSDIDSYSFLEELESGKGERFELSDIIGHIGEYSIDQHGSRFIQQKLENCSDEEKASVFKEVLVHASKLMTDAFGNYVIQKLFEYGSPDQKKELANQLESKILPLSLHMYGCRVIQKAFEVIDLEQKVQLSGELGGHVLKCVRDQHGNHVIQKCIECIPADDIEFIISSFRGQVANLSMHPYGCRVIQRVLEKRDDGLQVQFVVNEILDSVYSLAQDQYGNYVTQQVLKSGIPREKAKIIKKLSGSMVQLSQDKFASSVVEKCLEFGDASARDMLIRDIIGNSEKHENILKMMKDPYANYVVQKILLKCTSEQRELLLDLIRNHVTALKKCTYGKHIVARSEQLLGEEIQTS